MIIRKATIEDVPRLVEIGRHFLHASKYAQQIADNPEKATETLQAVVEKLGAIAVLENGTVQGMFAFVVFPHYFSGETFATELVWWLEPEARQPGLGLKLWEYAEKLATEMGADRMQMGAPDDKVGRMYRMRGYKATEVCYEKRLGAA